jgi:uncharacterized protein with von Willebrand factor type A (vWA) domain
MAIFSQGKRQEAVVVRDRYDRDEFEAAAKAYTPLAELLQTAQTPDSSIFIEDIFLTFFKPATTLVEDDELSLSAQTRRTLLVEVVQTQEYFEVKEQVPPYDRQVAAIATVDVCKAVISALDKTIVRILFQLHEAEAATASYLHEAEALEYVAGKMSGEEAQRLYIEARGLRDEARREELAALALAEQFEESSEEIEDIVRRNARAALEQAEEKIEQIQNAVRVFTLGLPEDQMYGVTIANNAKDKLALARQVMTTRKLKLIAELAGRMINTALYKQRSKVFHDPDEIVGVIAGNDLGKLLSSEMFKLGNEYLEMIFYQQYLERGLLNWDMVGHEKQARGPIVLGVDSTGSMARYMDGGWAEDEDEEVVSPNGETRYSKEVWSKALMFALLTIARKQNRDFAIIHFGGYQKQIRTFRFLKGHATPAELVEASLHFYNSNNTTFTFVVDQALKLTEESAFKHEDFVLVTDGIGDIADYTFERYQRVRKDRDMHSYGIYLPDAYDRGGEQALARLVDAQVSVLDLDKDDKALDLLFTNI